MDWYKYENNQPTEKRNTIEFVNVSISEDVPNRLMFFKPEEGILIE